MIRRITLENYMSHAQTVIEPATGLTVLVGPNNCGKSAVLSALQTVCGETAGEFMVRHGQKLCRVTIETDDDHTITWQRKGATISYTIDGQDIHRVGRGRLPDNLHTLLKMPVIDSPTGRKFQVHFGSQKDPIFLLDSDSDTAAFFSSSADSERLLEMQKRHKAKVISRRAEQRSIEADLKQLDEKLSLLSPLETLAPAVEQIEIEHQQVVEAQKQSIALEQHIDRLDRASARLRWLTAEAAALADLQSPPTLADEPTLQTRINEIEQWSKQRAVHQSRSEVLAALQSPPTMEAEQPLAVLGEAIARFDRQGTQWRKLAAALEPLEDPPVPIDTKHLELLGVQLKRGAAAMAKLQAVAQAVEPLQEPPAVRDLSSLENALKAFEKSVAMQTRCEAAVASAERELAQAKEAIVQYVMDHPACPTCGGALTPDHVIHGGTLHASR